MGCISQHYLQDQARVTSLLKRWLRISRCATLASIFHPDVTNFSYLLHVQEKAKLRLLAQVRLSQNRDIVEMEDMILDPEFAKRKSIPLRSLETLIFQTTLSVLTHTRQSPDEITEQQSNQRTCSLLIKLELPPGVPITTVQVSGGGHS